MKTTHLLLATTLILTGSLPLARAQTAINLGSASTFAVLAGSAITVAGVTTITGDIGSSPTPAITPGGALTLNGTNHSNDSITVAAKNDLTAAYADATSRGTGVTLGTELGGTVLSAGVYSSGSFGLTGTLTLDGNGDANSVFIFRAGSTFITEIGSLVSLTNGAQAANVFWQVGSSATFHDSSVIVGNVLALTSITAESGTSVYGRLLALNGAVTMNTDTITLPTAIPEPATTTALIAGSLLLLVGIQRRRRRAGA